LHLLVDNLGLIISDKPSFQCLLGVCSEIIIMFGLQQVEWSVSVKAIALMTDPMEHVWDSRVASVSVPLRRFITQKQGYGRRSGHLDACLLMKVVSCRCGSGSHIIVI
jgi:hypothetical protein